MADVDGKSTSKGLESQVTLRRLVKWYEEADEVTHSERETAETARNYYDGEQWTDDEKTELERCGQPVVTSNRIAPKVDFLIGGEIETRIDPKALPRTPAEESGAQAITDALRYAAGREGANFDKTRTAVAGELFVEGLSAGLLGVKVDGKRVRLTLDHVPYDRFWRDPRSRMPLLEDARYLGVVTWLAEDDAVEKYAKYPGAEALIRNASTASGSALPGEAHQDRPESWYDAKEGGRIKVAECYWREGGQWWLAHFVRHEFLIKPMLVPFVDEDGNTWCPLRPVSAKTSRTNDRYGPVKNMLSPQDEINKRRSLLLHALMQRRVIYETGAIDNVQDFQTELAKPDGAAEVSAGALVGGKVKVVENVDMAGGQAQLLAEAKAEIDATGPSAPVIAGDKSASGIAILRKKQIGNTELRGLFANIEEWQHGVILGFWWLIRQYWPSEMWLRVGDDEKKSGYRFVGLNRRMTKAARLQELVKDGVHLVDALEMVGLEPEAIQSTIEEAKNQAQQLIALEAKKRGLDVNNLPPEMQQLAQQEGAKAFEMFLMRSPALRGEFIANDVSSIGVDIILETSPDMAIVQEEQFEMLADMAAKGVFNPAMTPIPVMKMLLEASQLRDKRKLIAQIEEMSKPQDPAAAQAQAQAQQQQVAMQMQSMQAELAKLMAEIDKIKAETARTVAEIPGLQSAAQLHEANAMHKAVEAGQRSVPQMQQPPAMAAGFARRQ